MPTKRDLITTFWEKVSHPTGTGCLEWQACRTPSGYGQIRVNYKLCIAHRLAWEMAHGPIPDGLIVRHKCDNPPCVNIEHLELGTHKDNSDDKYKRGRGRNAFGEATGNAKLTEHKVLKIFQLRSEGYGVREIARMFNVAHTTVLRTLQGKMWKYLKKKTLHQSRVL